ncbi:hypothetical protein GIB67_039951 [Kingdonia uniflora]|uniref:Uncharacterized protein n=1 Tax=Kingdonia uniflora TaxID=39325 RepID=A0A7J7P3U1_9MAGN|nr:hypothetical protein GIB67_039951 [Kingdonia uniflora]
MPEGNRNVEQMLSSYHTHTFTSNQCSSTLVQTINAPLQLIWSIVRRFDRPQIYKSFIKRCSVISGSGGIGSVREIDIVSGLPAETSIERLDVLDDKSHVMSFSILGGDHRLVNYRSTVTLHAGEDGKSTVVVESYVVDVSAGCTKEDTCLFTDTIYCEL